MALILKPTLEKGLDGQFTSDVYVDNDEGVPPVGLCCPRTHQSEAEARSHLREELGRLLTGHTRIMVDGIEAGQDVEAALELVVVEAASSSKIRVATAESSA
jgi:hypothetical protein